MMMLSSSASQPPQSDADSGGHRHVLPLMCLCSAVVAGEVRLPGVESWLKFDKETPFLSCKPRGESHLLLSERGCCAVKMGLKLNSRTQDR